MYEPGYLRLLASGELEERVEQLYALLSSARSARATAATTGWRECSPRALRARDPVVSAYTPHFGEEPCLSGTAGAGNVFFGNCNLRCVYCQNWQISQDYAAQRQNEVTVERLAEMLLELQERGCHNIGFVSPTHYAPQMAKAVLLAAREGLRLPIVYNTNAYDSVEVLRLLEGIVDVYLPDLKYAEDAAGSLFSKVPDYSRRSREAIAEMYRQKGSRLELRRTTGCSSRVSSSALLVLPNGVAGVGGLAGLDRRGALPARRDLAHGAVLPDPPRGRERRSTRRSSVRSPRRNGTRRSRALEANGMDERIPAGARNGQQVLPAGFPRPREAVPGHPGLHDPERRRRRHPSEAKDLPTHAGRFARPLDTAPAVSCRH